MSRNPAKHYAIVRSVAGVIARQVSEGSFARYLSLSGFLKIVFPRDLACKIPTIRAVLTDFFPSFGEC
jgi:hypothetical protein